MICPGGHADKELHGVEGGGTASERGRNPRVSKNSYLGLHQYLEEKEIEGKGEVSFLWVTQESEQFLQ